MATELGDLFVFQHVFHVRRHHPGHHAAEQERHLEQQRIRSTIFGLKKPSKTQ